MSKINIYCLSLFKSDYKRIIKNNYIPVGLGNANFTSNWLTDDIGKNISYKNPYYGEYTFHYNIWKNESILNDHTGWIGFCTYRRFWQNKNDKLSENFQFQNSVLNHIPEEWENYQVILANKISIDGIKWMKVLKYGKRALFMNPGAILKKNRSIKFQFDMFHGNGVLDKAIELLDDENRNDFKRFVNTETSFNQCNMFICKSKSIMKDYYKTLFTWLEKCEDVFGFDLEGYGKTRIYAFLAERFLPYWFNKNTKVKEWPIFFYDLKNLNE